MSGWKCDKHVALLLITVHPDVSSPQVTSVIDVINVIVKKLITAQESVLKIDVSRSDSDGVSWSI